MRYKVTLFLTAILLSFSVAAKGRQAWAAPASSQMGNPTSTKSSRDCSKDPDTPRDTNQVTKRDQRAPEAQLESAGATATADADASPTNLEEDLKFLGQRQSELAQCILDANAQAPAQDSQGACF